MIEGTTSFAIAQRWLKEKNFGIFFVGYVDPLTPANKILSSKTGDTIRLTDTSDEIKVACEVETFRLTSHSNREELIDIVKRLKPKTVILVHGEKDGFDWLGHEILIKRSIIRVILTEIGKEYKIEL
jgi:Cft2 family RNA processing exonuclease